MRLPITPTLSAQPLGFGTWAWGNKVLWGYDEAQDAGLEAAFGRVTAADGPFFFDTGDSYGTGSLEGQAERLLGDFRGRSSSPERALIGTKLAVYPTRLTGASFEAACRASLGRMGRESIELVQAHWSAARFQPWQEPALLDGLARCYEAGLAQAVGTSNYGPRQLRLANEYWRERGVPHCTNQVQLSLLSTLPLESGLLDACAELGVTPIGYSPLGLGLLSGRYTADADIADQPLPRGPRGLLFRQILPGVRPLLATLEAVAAERGRTVPQVALNWCMSKGVLVIVGVRDAEQADAALGSLGWRLSDAEVDELDAASRKVTRKATQNIFQTD